MNRIAWLPTLALIIIGLAFVFPTITRAEGEIAVTGGGHENRYPAQIRFTVAAQSATEITRVTLRYKLVDDPATSSSGAQFSPGTSVNAEYVWDTRRKYIPPGVEIRYFWQIEDAAGHQIQTTPVTMTADDTRFQWQSLEAGRLSLFWYMGDRRFAQDLLDSGIRAVKQLGQEVGVELTKPAKIFVYQTQNDLLGALPPRGVEWTGGEAFPEAGIIVLTAGPTPSGREYGLRTIPHELSHFVVHAATDNPFGGVPRWLDEGLAMYAEGSLPRNFDDALQIGIAQNRLISLQSLAGNFPTDPDQSLLGYAESHSIVKFMLGKYGRDAMSKLLGIFRDGATTDDALRGAYSRDATALEREWWASIGAKDVKTSPSGAAPSPAPEGTPASGRSAPQATPASGGTAATPVPLPSTTGGRSCFGGLLSIAGAVGGLLLVAGRFRG